mmetsp:Transcript_14552/g.29087  ORF Transcript_14552/g.29087 Transcript_14552/m.29087 type:complete len:261 (-) Transcript_14552:171-953(-)|eukprot:CAMPEP_0181308552 /NCGR_PEP_ID=MMETSP1101-20121128/11529_1 /TAXON_ID=46948 /ORGANISM="Rhodomonas abbreviata, Strain Caron Lab Isolate" /LENGTH=260 /DNA_ID=CAMNT_0023414953 /DNA_START=148 /DNA_END=930 /DNA_ORIENTATION=+
MPAVTTFDIKLPSTAFNVCGATAGKISLQEAENMLAHRQSPHPQVDFENLLQNLENCGMRYYGGGLPIVSVTPGSAAAKEGLQAWDLIVKVGNKDVRPDSAREIVKELLRDKTSLTFTVLRSRNPPSGSVEVLKKKTSMFGCFSFSSNKQQAQKAGAFAPVQKAQTPVGNPRAVGSKAPNPKCYDLSSMPLPAHMKDNLAEAGLKDMGGEEPAEIAAELSKMTGYAPQAKKPRMTNKENQILYYCDDQGPTYQPGMSMAY